MKEDMFQFRMILPWASAIGESPLAVNHITSGRMMPAVGMKMLANWLRCMNRQNCFSSMPQGRFEVSGDGEAPYFLPKGLLAGAEEGRGRAEEDRVPPRTSLGEILMVALVFFFGVGTGLA